MDFPSKARCEEKQPSDDFGNEGERYCFSLTELLQAFSMALDLINPKLTGHHMMTCYVACRIGEKLGLEDRDQEKLFAASILHDVGAIALTRVEEALIFEQENPHFHARLGSVLLDIFAPFRSFSHIVHCHHVSWNSGEGAQFEGQPVPELAHILRIADRVAVLTAKETGHSISRIQIVEEIERGRDIKFKPELVDAFTDLSLQEAFWLDLTGEGLFGRLSQMASSPEVKLGLEGLLEFARFFSRIIDTRSRFTSAHSSGVAAAAAKAAEIQGLDPVTIIKVRVAGYLHDIGKLAVPPEILEKNAALDDREFEVVRSHTYHTRRILEKISPMSDIADWAANHHEELTGEGYPYRKSENELSMESRILSVADVFTALREDRPYRAGMPLDEVCELLVNMARDRKLERSIVDLFLSNLDVIDREQKAAQAEEIRDLEAFWNSIDPGHASQMI